MIADTQDHDRTWNFGLQDRQHMAYADNNYYPFMLRPYGAKRALLFECLSVLQPLPTYVDGPFSSALGWVLEHRNSHKEHLRPLRKLDGVELELRWLPDKWRKLIVTQDAAGDTQVHRKYLEMAVFMRIFEELQSGDLYVPRSEQYVTRLLRLRYITTEEVVQVLNRLKGRDGDIDHVRDLAGQFELLGAAGEGGPVVGERAGIVGLQMIGAHVIGWGVGEMVAGIGLHRIYFEHILRGRRPEQIELGALVGVVVHGGA